MFRIDKITDVAHTVLGSFCHEILQPAFKLFSGLSNLSLSSVTALCKHWSTTEQSLIQKTNTFCIQITCSKCCTFKHWPKMNTVSLTQEKVLSRSEKPDSTALFYYVFYIFFSSLHERPKTCTQFRHTLPLELYQSWYEVLFWTPSLLNGELVPGDLALTNHTTST